jgi:hypothetical protein
MPKVTKKSFKNDNMTCKDNIYCYVHRNCNSCNNKPGKTFDTRYDIILYTLGLYSIYSMYNQRTSENTNIRSISDNTNTYDTYYDKLHYYVYTIKEYVSYLCVSE